MSECAKWTDKSSFLRWTIKWSRSSQAMRVAMVSRASSALDSMMLSYMEMTIEHDAKHQHHLKHCRSCCFRMPSAKVSHDSSPSHAWLCLPANAKVGRHQSRHLCQGHSRPACACRPPAGLFESKQLVLQEWDGTNRCFTLYYFIRQESFRNSNR